MYNIDIWVGLLYGSREAIVHSTFLPQDNADMVNSSCNSLYSAFPDTIARALSIFREATRVVCHDLFERSEAAFRIIVEQHACEFSEKLAEFFQVRE